jgi:hypothetical protein
VLQLLLADLALLLALLLALVLPPHHVPVLPPCWKQVVCLWHKQVGLFMTAFGSVMKDLL